MQTLEAMISLLVLSSILLYYASAATAGPLDDSLYRLQLAEDSWRVLYLRGDFEGFGDKSGDRVQTDLETLGSQTGLCFFMSGLRMTNCPGGNKHQEMVRLGKTVIYDGAPKKIAFSIGK